MPVLFSSIAWKYPQAQDVATVLHRCGVQGIEASPGLFPKPFAELLPADIAAVRRFWEERSLPALAMQALLFGQPQLALFVSSREREAMADYLCLVFRVAGQLGGGPLIFGSPKNRLRGDLAPEAAFDIAADFFARLAPRAAAEGCTLCIEANAVGYGCDFITTHAEAAALVAAVNTEGFGLQIDTGVMQMNGETAESILHVLRTTSLLPAHVHISMPYLAPVTEADAEQCRLYQGLQELGYEGHISIEMKAPDYFFAAAPLAVAATRCITGARA